MNAASGCLESCGNNVTARLRLKLTHHRTGPNVRNGVSVQQQDRAAAGVPQAGGGNTTELLPMRLWQRCDTLWLRSVICHLLHCHHHLLICRTPIGPHPLQGINCSGEYLLHECHAPTHMRIIQSTQPCWGCGLHTTSVGGRGNAADESSSIVPAGNSMRRNSARASAIRALRLCVATPGSVNECCISQHTQHAAGGYRPPFVRSIGDGA